MPFFGVIGGRYYLVRKTNYYAILPQWVYIIETVATFFHLLFSKLLSRRYLRPGVPVSCYVAGRKFTLVGRSTATLYLHPRVCLSDHDSKWRIPMFL